MADYILGQAAIVSKGAWSASATYAVLNTVTHNGGSFMAIAANSNVEPGVASGWQTSWVLSTKGIKTITIAAVDSSTAQATVVFSDGTTVVGGTFNTAVVGDGSITQAKMASNSVGTTQLINGSVTAAKLGTDILPDNVGIKYGPNVPTTSDIPTSGQIYLKYEP